MMIVYIDLQRCVIIYQTHKLANKEHIYILYFEPKD